MKKTIAVILTAFLCLSVFAQTTKKLGPAVYDFATKASADWTIYDAKFKSMDITTDTYVFDGAFVIKNITGYSRYNFTCTVKSTNGTPSVTLSNMTSYSCNKNGVKTANGKTYTTSANVASQYAAQMQTEIASRSASLSDEQYEQNLSVIVTDPDFLFGLAKSNELKFKKFLSDYQVIGRPVALPIFVTTISESTVDGYAYMVKGTYGDLSSFDGLSVTFYSNNDSVIDLSTGERTVVKGTLTEASYTLGFESYTIVE